jgi:hypothetical protein
MQNGERRWIKGIAKVCSPATEMKGGGRKSEVNAGELGLAAASSEARATASGSRRRAGLGLARGSLGLAIIGAWPGPARTPPGGGGVADLASGRKLGGPRRARRLGRSRLGRAHGLGPIR